MTRSLKKSSQYKGVSRCAKDGKWQARIRFKDKVVYLGRFKKEIDALVKMGVDVTKNLILSKRAHLILPTHRLLDAASEASRTARRRRRDRASRGLDCADP